MESGDSKKRAVLLVCQSEDTLNALATILGQVGHRCLKAQTPESALKCVKTDTVQCVILDLSIPTTDALAIFRELRCSRTTASIPFLLLVSDGIVPALPPGTEPGCAPDAWLTLPCTARAFIDALRDLERKTVAYAQLSTETPPLLAKGGPGGPPASQSQAALKATLEEIASQSSVDGSSAHPASAEQVFLGKDGVFAGRICDAMDVPKVISVIEPLGLTGVLHLSDEKRLGQICFVDGRSRHAEFCDIEGEDALFLLLNMRAGNFRFEIAPAAERSTLQGNTMSLLLEGLRQMDETKAIITAHQQEKAIRVSERAKAIQS